MTTRRASTARAVPVVPVTDQRQLEAALAPIRDGRDRPVLVVVGGAAEMAEADLDAVEELVRTAIAPAVARSGAAVVDGGTDTGVMRLLGRARTARDEPFPLVGVAPEGRVAGRGRARAEPGHSLVLAVPGDTWGDESPWLLPTARVLAGDRPVVQLLINGGPIARREALAGIAAGVMTVVVAGSGRAADDLSHAWGPDGDPLPPDATIVSIDDPDPLARLLGDALAGPTEDPPVTDASTTPAAAPAASPPPRGASLASLIATLPLSPTQRQIVTTRWLDQMEWMGDKAKESQRRYHALRMTTVIGGVIVPAMVSISLGQASPEPIIRWATFAVSLMVAISAAVEGFFHYGDRWRHYRGTAELLKSEGWQFLTGVGAYRRFEDLEERYTAFIGRVEDILRQDVEGYLTEVAATKASERYDVFTRI